MLAVGAATCELTPDACLLCVPALEQQAVDLTGQLEERNEELQAARAADRQLISRLNTSH